jgi:hypothetical protein
MNSIRIRIVVAALLVAVVALTLASPASAFVRLTRQGVTGIVQAHWYDSQFPLLSVVNATNNDISYASALSVVQTSAKAWENINTSYFTVNPVDWTSGPYLTPSLSTTDGQNSMFFDQAGVNFAPGGGVIAFVRTIVDLADGHTLDADMTFNDRDFFCSTASPVPSPAPPGQTTIDLQSVVTHEYGHYFSLDHTSVANATMIPFIISGSTIQRTLELDDQAGISAVYPESAARGLSPDGVDFYATRGTVSGTVVSGYNGSAIFGAHVEAWNLAAPTAENSISAISGELTVRNGQGDFKIHGLPPGSYALRIVPLDGVNTIAADANVGGIFNGLDINFLPEFWNGGNESGNGFNDLANDITPVAVSAGADAGGIGFITNTFPGQVEIAQYGAFENTVTDRSNAYRAVRFDPPFDPPYTITKVTFPTFTFNGVPAPFTSVSLVPMAANGTPNLAAPLFTLAPFSGSANGNNVIPVNLVVNSPNQTFFWVLRWPPRPGSFPNNHAFVRIDYTSLERGLFLNSYSTATLTGAWSLGIDRNVAVSMFCQVGSPEMAPIQASSNLGANRRDTKVEFKYAGPGDFRADGFPLPHNSLLQTDLLRRPAFGAWTYEASGGAGSDMISRDSIPSGIWVWSTQAVDKYGHKAILSSATLTGLNADLDEPNGRLNEAKPVTPPVLLRGATYAPAGDQDYYTFTARVGDIIDASAVSQGQDGANDLDLVMFLFDTSGEIVAFDDDSNGGLNPRVTFAVPPPSVNSNSNAPRKFTILITDFRGSFLNPTGAPRVVVPENYGFSVNVTSPVASAARFSRGLNEDGYGFALGGPNPANPTSKLVYVLPRAADGTRVSLRVYDVHGRMVRTLVDRNEVAGPHTVIWDGTDASGRRVSSGTYFARIEAGTFRQEARVVFVK